jgi:hydroxyacylglutathione hydrolase
VATVPFLDTDYQLGQSGQSGRVVALIGTESGRYPFGNSLMVAGTEETVLIDPSLAVAARGGAPSHIDRMLISHAHEDHTAGVSTFPHAHVHAHNEDLLALHSLEGYLQVYGMPPEMAAEWGPKVVEEFNYQPRLDATGFADGQRFDLGGGLRIEVVHLPGHTRGHSGFLIEPDGVFFVADIDLSAFGPYYGDHWSDLEDFERAIERCRTIDAKYYVTFHHKGIVHVRQDFLTQLDAFSAVIAKREQRLLDYLGEPRTLEEMIAYRIIYRPNVEMLFVSHVERVSIGHHLHRMVRTGSVHEVEPGVYRAA